MARKPALDIETLLKFGPEKLARLVLDETQDNPGFKRRVAASPRTTDPPIRRCRSTGCSATSSPTARSSSASTIPRAAWPTPMRWPSRRWGRWWGG